MNLYWAFLSREAQNESRVDFMKIFLAMRADKFVRWGKCWFVTNADMMLADESSI